MGKRSLHVETKIISTITGKLRLPMPPTHYATSLGNQRMTDAETIAAIRTQTLALLAAITAEPKPSYSIDGQSMAWTDYLAQLRQMIAWCDEKLAGIEPVEIETQGTM
jgi:hypothetical protein